MRKAILAIAAAGSVFAVTAAGATGIAYSPAATTLNVAGRGQQSVHTNACTGTPVLGYTLGAGGDAGKITAVTVTGMACPAPGEAYQYTFAVVLTDGGVPTTYSGSFARTADTVVAAEDVTTITMTGKLNTASQKLVTTDLTITPEAQP